MPLQIMPPLPKPPEYEYAMETLWLPSGYDFKKDLEPIIEKYKSEGWECQYAHNGHGRKVGEDGRTYLNVETAYKRLKM